MLGFALLFLIGRGYYLLADKYDKNKWIFGIVGIATYYAGTIIFAFFFGIVATLSANASWLEIDNTALGFMALPFGLLFSWILYFILKRNWSSKKGEDKQIIADF